MKCHGGLRVVDGAVPFAVCESTVIDLTATLFNHLCMVLILGNYLNVLQGLALDEMWYISL